MAELILVACVMAFLFGLVQWARGGAVLWDVIRLSRRKTVPDESGSEKTEEERQKAAARARRMLRDLENLTDRLLRSSFRVLGILALCVWLFVVVSVVVDVLGLDWLDNLSFRANRLWGDPYMRATYNDSQSRGAQGGTRGTILRSISSGLRR
ncbi:MAG: hypothetical protein LBQ90_00500 [Synergistaceae bacterium]|jgi:hypothetical protein|nr:hypothetical protein [Synergistaceae bacterium]